MSSTKFPNLFIVGAMKAGTSSLHEYLHQHPEIFMSRFKEPQYFAPHKTRWGLHWGQGNPHPEPGMEWYLRLFENAGNVKYAGESSVSYTAVPWVTNCHLRIHAFNPSARIIYIMRDPVARALSHYWHFVIDGREDREPLKALKTRSEYISRSQYAMQLRPYISTFGRQQVHVLSLEELISRPDETLTSVFRWLGVRTNVAIATTEKHNVTASVLQQTRRGRVFLDTFIKGWRWQSISKRLPGFVNSTLGALTHRTVDRKTVDLVPAKRYLHQIFEDSIIELVSLVGREFPEWDQSDDGLSRRSKYSKLTLAKT